MLTTPIDQKYLAHITASALAESFKCLQDDGYNDRTPSKRQERLRTQQETRMIYMIWVYSNINLDSTLFDNRLFLHVQLLSKQSSNVADLHPHTDCTLYFIPSSTREPSKPVLHVPSAESYNQTHEEKHKS